MNLVQRWSLSKFLASMLVVVAAVITIACSLPGLPTLREEGSFTNDELNAVLPGAEDVDIVPLRTVSAEKDAVFKLRTSTGDMVLVGRGPPYTVMLNVLRRDGALMFVLGLVTAKKGTDPRIGDRGERKFLLLRPESKSDLSRLSDVLGIESQEVGNVDGSEAMGGGGANDDPSRQNALQSDRFASHRTSALAFVTNTMGEQLTYNNSLILAEMTNTETLQVGNLTTSVSVTSQGVLREAEVHLPYSNSTIQVMWTILLLREGENWVLNPRRSLFLSSAAPIDSRDMKSLSSSEDSKHRTEVFAVEQQFGETGTLVKVYLRLTNLSKEQINFAYDDFLVITQRVGSIVGGSPFDFVEPLVIKGAQVGTLITERLQSDLQTMGIGKLERGEAPTFWLYLNPGQSLDIWLSGMYSPQIPTTPYLKLAGATFFLPQPSELLP